MLMFGTTENRKIDLCVQGNHGDRPGRPPAPSLSACFLHAVHFLKILVAKPLQNAYTFAHAQRQNICVQGANIEDRRAVTPVTGQFCVPVRFACVVVGETIAIPL